MSDGGAFDLITGKSFSPNVENIASLALEANVPRNDRCFDTSFSFATFYLAFRNQAIQRKVRKVDDKTWLCQFVKKIFFACQLDRYSTHSNIFIIILINYAKLR
jgi:hypothetical protein